MSNNSHSVSSELPTPVIEILNMKFYPGIKDFEKLRLHKDDVQYE
ncbi:MAG: hypothetical protein ABIG93_00080 [archaeon]